jgi:flagellar basal body-associated protein FliL
MAEEQENDGTWGGLKKTIIGVAGTLVTAGGVWVSTLLGGGDKAEPAQPVAQPVINLNVANTNTQNQSNGGDGKTVIIKEKPSSNQSSQPQSKPKKKEGDEFKEKPAEW